MPETWTVGEPEQRPQVAPMRWSEIASAAVILGIVPDFSRGSMFKIVDMLATQVQSGRVKKSKEGDAQSAPASYWIE